MTKVFINEGECIGCGLCVNFAPDVLEIDQKNFKCKTKQEKELSAEEMNQIKEAVENCPVRAIKLLE